MKIGDLLDRTIDKIAIKGNKREVCWVAVIALCSLLVCGISFFLALHYKLDIKTTETTYKKVPVLDVLFKKEI